MTAETNLATREPLRLEASEIELIKRTVANGATNEELKLFLHDCRRQGVHPLDKMIHFTKRAGRYTPITSIDFMRMQAAETNELAGNDDPQYVFRDGEPTIPQSASVTVYRLTQGHRFAYTATARWAEYKPPAGQDHMWLKMPQLMLGKCAEALALRKAFPKQLHGLYERAEMAQAGREDLEGRSHGEAAGERPAHEPVRASGGGPEKMGSGGPRRQVEAEITVPSEALFDSSLTPLGEEHTALDQKIAQATPSRIAVMMRRFDLGDGDWTKLDLASKAMLVKHLDSKAK